MNSPLVLDIVLVAVVALFALLGAHRGFVLTLCSLLAVLVAFIGASFLSAAATPAVAGMIRPPMEQAIQGVLEDKAGEMDIQEYFRENDVVNTLREQGGVFAWAVDAAEDTLNEVTTQSVAAQTAAVASAAAAGLSHGVLFSLFFLLLLLVWGVVSHALDLVSKLPVINSLNHLLGGVLGAAKGLLLALAAVWILRDLTGFLDRELIGQTRLLSPLLLLLHIA